mmetsp:Transcript_9604/g.19079  ORF Transcript_9604/g.19079 Transcript_9604/m.19079 type:complete len:85 (+) Transcript_9604:1431-1685(+)
MANRHFPMSTQFFHGVFVLLSNVWIRYDDIGYKYFRFDGCNSTTSRRWGMTGMHGGSQIIQLRVGRRTRFIYVFGCNGSSQTCI